MRCWRHVQSFQTGCLAGLQRYPLKSFQKHNASCKSSDLPTRLTRARSCRLKSICSHMPKGGRRQKVFLLHPTRMLVGPNPGSALAEDSGPNCGHCNGGLHGYRVYALKLSPSCKGSPFANPRQDSVLERVVPASLEFSCMQIVSLGPTLS